jgi:hypothetical protein
MPAKVKYLKPINIQPLIRRIDRNNAAVQKISRENYSYPVLFFLREELQGGYPAAIRVLG